MKKMTKVLALVLALAMCLALCACGKGESKDTAGDKKTFIIGVDPEYPPFSYLGDDGKFTGFDVEICQAVCDLLGWDLQVFGVNWDQKLVQLDSKECDCVWSGMTILDSMKDAGYVLSTPYYDNTQVIMVKEGSDIKSSADLAGKNVAVQLGIDPRKSDQAVRGAVVMPEGTGKTVRVAVFTQGAKADEAREAGADIVGFDDLAAQVKAGQIDFDVVIASPDAMRVVGQLGQILGPRGLMPNPKVGTVTPNVAQAVKNAKAGQVQFRADKAGIIHAPIGRASFEAARLQKNLAALIEQLNKLKPASAKGQYIRKISVSSTMGLGVRVDVGSINE